VFAAQYEVGPYLNTYVFTLRINVSIMNRERKMPSITREGCSLCMLEIYLQNVRFKRDNLQVIYSAYIKIIKKCYWVMSGVYINEI
jgi:hypothetical protein